MNNISADMQLNSLQRCIVLTLVFLVFCSRFMPEGLSYISISAWGTFINLFVLAAALIILLFDFRIDSFSIVFFTFTGLRFVSDIINCSNYIVSIKTFAAAIAFFIIVKWALNKNWRSVLITIQLFFIAVLIVNFFFLISRPDGFSVDLYGKPICFIGNRNSIVNYALGPLLASYILISEETNWAIRSIWGILWGILILTYCEVQSLTSIIGLAILFICLLFLNKDKIIRYANLKSFSLLSLIAFIVVVIKQLQGGLVQKFLSIVKKSPTLSGRTPIWRDYIREFPNEIVLGHGTLDLNSLKRVFGNSPASTVVHAHNIQMNIYFQNGIIGLILFTLLFALVVKNFKYIKNKRVKRFFEIFLGVLLFMSQFESYKMEMYYLVMIIMYTYIERERGLGNE